LVEFVPKEDSRLEQAIGESNLLVNATPCGMKKEDPCIIQEDWLHEGLTVYDLIYHRLTPLVDKSRKRGLTAEPGLSMLLYQAVLAFELWTGKKAPVDVMKRVLEEEIQK
jgi:shikimate dehydrogenase